MNMLIKRRALEDPETKQCPECTSPIPVAAKGCPLCTTRLEGGGEPAPAGAAA